MGLCIEPATVAPAYVRVHYGVISQTNGVARIFREGVRAKKRNEGLRPGLVDVFSPLLPIPLRFPY